MSSMRAGIAADQQRLEVVLDRGVHRQQPLGEGGAAEAVQARLGGLDLDHRQADARGRREDAFHISDLHGDGA